MSILKWHLELFSINVFVIEKVKARNRRLFGSIQDTLQKFSMEEKKKKDMTQKKKEVEQKIEEKTEKEREDLKLKRRELLDEQRQKKQDIRSVQFYQSLSFIYLYMGFKKSGCHDFDGRG